MSLNRKIKNFGMTLNSVRQFKIHQALKVCILAQPLRCKLNNCIIISPGQPEPEDVIWIRPEDVLQLLGEKTNEPIGMFDQGELHSNDVI